MREEQQHESVSIHAGFPNPAADKGSSSLDVHQLLIPRPASSYIFRIAGDQWQDMGIYDGDIAIIDRALGVRKADIVAWWNDEQGEFNLSYSRDIPEQAQVFGVVTSTIHQFRKPS
jgi:SOS-response transcriptional repressor LexA